jgi:hypothetical protein
MFTYYNSKATEERKARIERINEQVRLTFLSPLFNVSVQSPTKQPGLRV